MFLKMIDKRGGFYMQITSYEVIGIIETIVDKEQCCVKIFSKKSLCLFTIPQKTLEEAVTLANELQQKIEKNEKCIIEVE